MIPELSVPRNAWKLAFKPQTTLPIELSEAPEGSEGHGLPQPPSPLRMLLHSPPPGRSPKIETSNSHTHTGIESWHFETSASINSALLSKASMRCDKAADSAC